MKLETKYMAQTYMLRNHIHSFSEYKYYCDKYPCRHNINCLKPTLSHCNVKYSELLNNLIVFFFGVITLML
jgi:hypothetical protein